MRNRNHEPGLSPISNKDITNAFQNLKPFLPEGELTRSELLKRIDREPVDKVRRDSRFYAHTVVYSRINKDREGNVTVY